MSRLAPRLTRWQKSLRRPPRVEREPRCSIVVENVGGDANARSLVRLALAFGGKSPRVTFHATTEQRVTDEFIHETAQIDGIQVAFTSGKPLHLDDPDTVYVALENNAVADKRDIDVADFARRMQGAREVTLLLGEERDGLSPLAMERAQHIVTVPHPGCSPQHSQYL